MAHTIIGLELKVMLHVSVLSFSGWVKVFKKHQKAWAQVLTVYPIQSIDEELQNYLEWNQHNKLANGSFQPQKIHHLLLQPIVATHAIVSLIGGRIDSNDF